MIYWGLMKWNDGFSKTLNIIYNIITCNPEPQANGPEWCLVHVRIILLNLLRASRTHSPNQTEVSETVLQVMKWKILWFLIVYVKRLADED